MVTPLLLARVEDAQAFHIDCRNLVHDGVTLGNRSSANPRPLTQRIIQRRMGRRGSRIVYLEELEQHP